MTGSSFVAKRSMRPGARLGSIREVFQAGNRDTSANRNGAGAQSPLALRSFFGSTRHGDAALEPTAPRAPAHGREPWDRPCHGQTIFSGRVARHHLLAPCLSGKLPVGNG